MGVACRYGIVVGLLTVRPGRYGKGRREDLAEGLQGRSVRGRVGQWQDGPVQEVLAVV